MRRLVLRMSMSLDGYVDGPDGDNDWMMRTRSPEGVAWVEQMMWGAGAHLVGRRSFEGFSRFWPTAEGPLAAPMNTIPKIVFSTSGKLPIEPGTAPGWDDARVLGSDLAADIAALKAEPGKDLLAHGGVSFARSLIRLGLVDEYLLGVHPVVLGSGAALFEGMAPFDLTLVDAIRFPVGTQMLIYRPK
jgi:dihydrofolate reductase